MVSQKSSLLSCCAHLKRHGQKRGREEITQVCIGSYKLSQGQDLGKASIIPCCITLSRTIPMAPVYLQGRLGHVMLPTCRHSNIIGEYLANFCHIMHLSYPDTHLTSSQALKTPTFFPSGVNIKAIQPLDSAPIRVMHGLFLPVKQPVLP